MPVLIRGASFADAPLLLNRKDAAAKVVSASGGTLEARLEARLYEVSDAGDAKAAEAASEPVMTFAEFEQSLGEQLDVLKQEAWDEGMREGREQAEIEVRKKASAQLEAMTTFMRDARACLEEEIHGMDELGVEIVFEAVAKILGQAATNPEAVAEIVREVIRGAKDRSRLVVRVRRADLDWISLNREQLLSGIDAGSVDFVADDRVRLGGCILETPIGNLDGRLETQLAGLRDILLTARMRADEDGDR